MADCDRTNKRTVTEDDGVVSLVHALFRTLEHQGYILPAKKALNGIGAPQAHGAVNEPPPFHYRSRS
jgi:hypothetical protein